MRDERAHFLQHEWPKVLIRIERLGLDPTELLPRKQSAT
jgi:predicted ATP-dependent Lon-type protease